MNDPIIIIYQFVEAIYENRCTTLLTIISGLITLFLATKLHNMIFGTL